MLGLLRVKTFPAITTSLIALLLLHTLSSHSLASIRTFEGIVKKVVDGDSVTVVTTESTKLRVRFYGIDAPEIRHGRHAGQPCGQDAKRVLEEKVLGRWIILETHSVDRYKRVIGIIHIGSRNINEEMVMEGWAWAYREYLKGPYVSEFIDAERRAR
jgi:endonuclease YncB( thermonuclease family)